MANAQDEKDGADQAASRDISPGADGDRVLDQVADTELALRAAQANKNASDKLLQDAAAKFGRNGDVIPNR